MNRSIRRSLSAWALLAAVSAPAWASDVAMSEVVLRGLDKGTGRVSTITAAVGDTIHFGSLAVVIQTCRSHPPEETPENSAFLDISEIKTGEPAKSVFRGWMFSSSPAVSALEHPVYDIWLIECRKPRD